MCTLRFNFLLPELAPVTCDVPSTTIGIAELISVHLSSPCSSRNNTRRRNPCDSFSIAAETPVTCDLSPVSSGPLSIVQSESTLAAPRGGTPACPGVSYSQHRQRQPVGGGSRTHRSQHYLVLEQRLRRRPGCRRLAALTTALPPRTALGPRGRTASRPSFRWTRAA